MSCMSNLMGRCLLRLRCRPRTGIATRQFAGVRRRRAVVVRHTAGCALRARVAMSTCFADSRRLSSATTRSAVDCATRCAANCTYRWSAASCKCPICACWRRPALSLTSASCYRCYVPTLRRRPTTSQTARPMWSRVPRVKCWARAQRTFSTRRSSSAIIVGLVYSISSGWRRM